MPALYEQVAAFRELMERKEAEEFAEITPEEIDAVLGTIEQKVENVAGFIKDQDAEAEKFQAEAARLKQKASSFANRARWLKGYLEGCLRAAGLKKVAAGVHTVRFQTNGGNPSVEYAGKPEDLLKINPEFVHIIPQQYQIDAEAIVQAIKAKPDLKLPDGLTVTRGQHLRIA